MGALGKIGAIVRLHVTQIAHDRSELFSSFVLPLLLTALLGFMFGGPSEPPKTTVAIVDLDGSAVSRVIGDTLRDQESMEVSAVSRDEAVVGIDGEEYAAAVVVPKGFGDAVIAGRNAEIEFIERDGNTLAFAARQVVEGVATRLSADQVAVRVASEQVSRARGSRMVPAPGGRRSIETKLRQRGGFGLGVQSPTTTPTPLDKAPVSARPLERAPEPAGLFATADSFWTPAPVKVESAQLSASAVRGESTVAVGHEQSSLGVTVWFILMMLLGSAVTLLEERENKTLPRLLTTPTPRALVLAGKVAALFLVGIVQAAVLIVFGAAAFGVPWGSDPVPVAAVIGTYTLACTGMAIALAAVARTRSQASGLGPVVSVALAMIGGTMWPLAIVPPAMQTLAMFTPTGQAMSALTDIVVRNQGIEAAVAPSLALLAMAVVFFGIGLSRFKYE